MERTTLFAELLLPLPIKGLFTYRVPFELNEFIRPGQRVAVQFGRKKLYTALVKNIHEKVPEGYTSVEFSKKMLDEKIALVATPGSFLSEEVDGVNPGEGFVRFALVPSIERTKEAARRIKGLKL